MVPGAVRERPPDEDCGAVLRLDDSSVLRRRIRIAHGLAVEIGIDIDLCAVPNYVLERKTPGSFAHRFIGNFTGSFGYRNECINIVK